MAAKRKATVTKKVTKSKKSLADLLFNDLESMFKADEKKAKAQRKKKREKIPSSKWTKTKVLIPKTGETYTATKYKLNARTGYVQSPLEIAMKLESMKSNIKKIVKEKFRRGEGLSIGYEFTFKFDKEVYQDNLVQQAGYANRVFVGGENLEKDLEFIMEEITERFSKYLERNHCLGVNLANIILEKTSAPKLSIEDDGTEMFQVSRVQKKAKKRKKKTTRRK